MAQPIEVKNVTTYFVGTHYEVTGSEVTKYYYAGTQRIAMRKNGTLNFILGDHLGSTSLVTDSNGVVISETKYKAWGETRYSSGTSPTDYTYTGQYSYADDFGLMYYGARWYDPSLSRFTQPDSLIPPSHGVQKWDHYAYVNNNPLIYTDPSGHIAESFWDAASLGIGVVSLVYNLSQGNYADAAIDTVGIVVDAAALAVPFVPGGAGAIIKAYRAGDAALEIAETAVKYSDEVVEAAAKVLAEATQNADRPLAVLGSTQDKYYELANSIEGGATHLFSDSAKAFYDKYGKEAFWELINKPFVQQEIIDKGKTVLLATPYDTIIEILPKTSVTRWEIDLLEKARYTRITTPIGDALVHAPY